MILFLTRLKPQSDLKNIIELENNFFLDINNYQKSFTYDIYDEK